MVLFVVGMIVGGVIWFAIIYGLLHIGDLNERRQNKIDAEIDKLHE